MAVRLSSRGEGRRLGPGEYATAFVRKYVVALKTRCWFWRAAIAPNGYGRFNLKDTTGRSIGGGYAHRYAYIVKNGFIPDGTEIDHLCRNRHCCNPDHLEAVTRRENIVRGLKPAQFGALNGAKQSCKRGHPFDDANTIWRPPPGGRRCRMCEYENSRRHADRMKAKRHARGLKNGTPEQRSAIAKVIAQRAWATRRANAATST